MKIEDYFKELEDKIKVCYSVAEEARKKGLDPLSKVEIPLATSLAGRVAGLLATIYPQLNNPTFINRIIELEKEYGSLDPCVSLKIAEEVAKERVCKFRSLLEAIDAGIRAGLAYTTLGVVSSPIEGFTQLKIGKTKNGQDYFILYFSGPIRSAGGTGAAFSLVIADYLRETLGYSKYDPSDREVKRAVTEIYDYHERITNLQYLPTEEEAEFLAKNIPLQINGDASEDKEVSNYKDLERIETNMIRGGFCLTFAEGLAQKAAKILKMIKKSREKGFKLTDWDFLEEYNKIHQKREKGTADTSPTYIKDLVAGRPVLGHPSASGSFRLRYGRARNTGYSALAIHPATMRILNDFIAIGSQIKIEMPTKGAAIANCDTIDGPIIKMKNGSVTKGFDEFEAKNLYKDTEEILYLGDLLVPYGDFINRNHLLAPAGYTEQEWFLELKNNAENELIELDDIYDITLQAAIELSEKFSIPLHPKFIFYWSQINYEDFMALIDWLAHSRFEKKLILPYNRTEKERFQKAKRALELLGVEHEIITENVITTQEEGLSLLANLGLSQEKALDEQIDRLIKSISNENILEIINKNSKFKIKDKAGTFIGARMGRPEKAKLRKLVGSPNVLFPVGEEGGRLGSINETLNTGFVKADFPIYFCQNCNKETIYFICPNCKSDCKKMNYCPECQQKFFSEKCPQHNLARNYSTQKIDMKEHFKKAVESLDLLPTEIPSLIKGVRGTSNKNHVPEALAKGILRAAFNLQVNKDGTIRFDATEMPLTHFKPVEISVSVEKLKSIGYIRDIYGRDLENEEQILELKPHDILLPSCPESNDEKADDVFLRVMNFIDSLLVRFYKLKPFYNATSRDDLVGHLVSCIAPHNCASVVGRIIGFSKTQTLIAHPYIHAAMRRDCVYPTTKTFLYNADTKEIFYDEIGEHVEKLIANGAKTKKIDSFGTLQVENTRNLYALGIDPNTHELKKKKIKHFIKGPETSEWIKITTATNREFVMTPTHKFMHIQNGEFKIKRAKDIKENDKLPILENFNLYTGKKEIDLIKLFKEKLSEKEQKEILVISNKETELLSFNEKNYQDCKLRHKFSKHTLPAIFLITPELLRTLGYYSSEGYSRQNKTVSQVSFRICNSEIQKHLVKLIKKVFNIRPNLGEGNSKITICSKLVYYLFRVIGAGASAYKKRVPSFIFGLENELVREYISTFFEGDGSVIKAKKIIAFYSVSRDLLDDIALLLTKFRIISRYFRTNLQKLPKVLERYQELGKEPKQHILNHLVLEVYDSFKLKQILNLTSNKALDLKYLEPTENRYLHYNNKQILLEAQSDYVIDYVKKTEIIKDNKNSYCFSVEANSEEDQNVLWAEQVTNLQCDGDEAAIMLLLDMLINFSREFLPAHRGGTQDAPLVLNARIKAGEVDDMIFDIDVERELPLELYERARLSEHPSKVKISQIRNRLGKNEFHDLWYSYEVGDINSGALCSNYKKLATMQEKVLKQMELAEKIRAVNTTDVARLVIDRHFIRDIRGNLRKFSQQEFRCSKCNEKYRRPPLIGRCYKCNGNVIFTISQGSIIKYLEPALQLATKYNIPAYLKQSLELTKSYIESIFGIEKEKQEALKKWF